MNIQQKIFVFIFFALDWSGQPTLALAGTDPCSLISQDYRALSTQPSIFNHLTWQDYQANSSKAYVDISQIAFDNYLQQGITPDAFESCLDGPDQINRLRYQLSFIFFTQSLKSLSSWNLPISSRFAQDISSRYKNGSIVSFGVNANPDGDHSRPALLLGGFHKGNRGLYLDPRELPSSQWFLIFFHEFSHAMDDLLGQEVDWAKDQSHWNDISSLLSKATWTPEETAQVDRWLLNGLNRGFLAEYRAWTSTADLYLEARAHKVIPDVSWFDDFLGQKHTASEVSTAVFQKLDSTFSDPVDAPFNDPKVMARLKAIRARLRQGVAQGKLPELSSLQQY